MRFPYKNFSPLTFLGSRFPTTKIRKKFWREKTAISPMYGFCLLLSSTHEICLQTPAKGGVHLAIGEGLRQTRSHLAKRCSPHLKPDRQSALGGVEESNTSERLRGVGKSLSYKRQLFILTLFFLSRNWDD